MPKKRGQRSRQRQHRLDKDSGCPRRVSKRCCISGNCELIVYSSQKFAISAAPKSARLRFFCRRDPASWLLFAASISTNRRRIDHQVFARADIQQRRNKARIQLKQYPPRCASRAPRAAPKHAAAIRPAPVSESSCAPPAPASPSSPVFSSRSMRDLRRGTGHRPRLCTMRYIDARARDNAESPERHRAWSGPPRNNPPAAFGEGSGSASGISKSSPSGKIPAALAIAKYPDASASWFTCSDSKSPRREVQRLQLELQRALEESVLGLQMMRTKERSLHPDNRLQALHGIYLGSHASLSRSGNVICTWPGSIPSSRANPLSSSEPEAIEPSGMVT